MAKVPPAKKNTRKGSPPGLAETVGNLEKPDAAGAELAPMNFRVPEPFRREFKVYAASHGISMLELLQEGFRLIKEHGIERTK